MKQCTCALFFVTQGRSSDISSGLFLLDNTRVSQLCLSTGKTRRSFPSLSDVQSQLALTYTSHSGSVLVGLTAHGHMFTWLHPSRQLVTYTTPLSAPSPHLEDLKGTCVCTCTFHACMRYAIYKGHTQCTKSTGNTLWLIHVCMCIVLPVLVS